ncbi:MAG: hypothetical protein HYV17_08075 [Xanthomonadales bacterium]|nr:hypothetical protein [Xanthomonadales bacterium]
MRATQAFEAGKSYFWTVHWDSGTALYVGVGNAAASLAQAPGANANGWALNAGTGQKYTNGVLTAYQSGIAAGGTIGVLMRWKAATSTWDLVFTSTGLLFSSVGHTGLSGTLYPMVGSTVAFAATANFGQTVPMAIPALDGGQPGIWTQAAAIDEVLRYASETFITGSASTPANTLYEGRLAKNSDPVIKSDASTWIDGGGSATTTIAEIVFNNGDRQLNDLAGLILRDRPVEFLYGDETDVLDPSTCTPYANGTLDRHSDLADETVKFVFGDMMLKFDQAAVTAKYPTWIQEPSLVDRNMPLCLGLARNIDPVVVETALGYNDVHDDAILAVDAVSDQGDPDTYGVDYTNRNNGFDRVFAPVGKSAATIRGAVKRGTALFNEAFAAWSAGAFDPNPTGWTVSGESGTNERVYERTAGRCALKKNGAAPALYMERNIGLVAGTTYVCVVNCTYWGSGGIEFRTATGGGVQSSIQFLLDSSKRDGVHAFCFTPAASHTHLRVRIEASNVAEAEFESIDVYPATLIEQLQDWITEIAVTRSGFSTSDLDTTGIAAMNALLPYTLGFYSREPITRRQLLVETMNSFCGWIGPDRLNQLSVGRLQEPAPTPVMTLTEDDLLDDWTRELDRAPKLSTSIGAARNWSRHTDADFAGSVPAATKALLRAEYQSVCKAVGVVDPIYEHARTAAPFGTLLRTAADAQLLADHIAVCYRAPRFWYAGSTLLETDAAIALKRGDTISIELPKFGYSSGVLMVVRGIELGWRRQVVKLKLRGP